MTYVNTTTDVLITLSAEDEEKKVLWDKKLDNTERKRSFGGILRHILQGPKQRPDMSQANEKVHAEIRRGAAEFLGMFIISLSLTFIGVTHHVAEEKTSLPILTAMVDGFIHAVLIYTISAVSGGHFNPTLSLAFCIKGSFKFWRVMYYWFSQFTGAIAGCLVVYLVFGQVEHIGTPHPISVTDGQAFFIEIIGSFIDIMVILAVAETSYIIGTHAAIAVAFSHFVIGILFFGAAESKFNIALAAAPTIISKTHFHTIWIYILGPIIGALIALMVSRIFITVRQRQETTKEATGTSMLNPTAEEEAEGREDDE